MIGVLLRKDPAIRTLPPLVLGGGVLGALAAVSVGKLLENDSEIWKSVAPVLAVAPLIQVLLLSWITAMGGWAGVRERAGELHLTLPVPLRTLVGLRMLALLLVGWLPLAITALAMLLGVRVPEAREVMLRAAGASALVWAAWVAACFAWKPERPRLDSLPAFLAITAVGLGLTWVALQAPALAAPAALLLLVPAGIAAWRGIPAVMQLGQDEGARARADDGQGQAVPTRGAASSLRAWVARRTFLLGRNIALLAGLVFMAFVGPGSQDSISIELLWAVFFTSMVIAHSTRVLRDVGHLPIGRTRLAAWVLLPPLLAMGLGLTGALLAQVLDPGTHWAQEVDILRRRMAGDGDSKRDHVVVPGALLRPVLKPALGSGAVVVTAPWGESAALLPEPLIPGLPLAFVNPYDITPESSIDFVAWQLSRAVRDAYGVEVAPDELRERYLSVLQGRVIGPFFDQRFLEDHPEVQGVSRPGVVGWSLATLVLAWLLAGWWATRQNVPPVGRGEWRRARTRRIVLQVAGLLAFLGLVLASLGWDRRLPGVADSLAAALARAVGGSEWPVPALALVAAVSGFAWLARRFERTEVPPPLPRSWAQSPE